MKIKVEKVSAGYGGAPVISEISIAIPHGKIITLIGSNGSGKSTILKTMSRSLKPYSGAVYLDGKEVHSYNSTKLARKLAHLPQAHGAPEDMTVEELVNCGRFPHRKLLGSSRKRDMDVIGHVLSLTKLEHLRERSIHALSGGERQRAWIALCLAQEPEILLLDEPTTFLDVCYQFELLEMIAHMNKTLGLTIVMVLHDLNHAARYSNHIIAVKDRRIYKEGPASEIITTDVLKDVFNIKAKIVHHDGIPHFIPIGSYNSKLAEKI